MRPTLLVRLWPLVAISLLACTGKSEPSASDAATCVGCHGSDGVAAPPRSTQGATATADVGVGAHRAHVTPGSFRRAVACDECHVVPETVTAPGHQDGRADVAFRGLAAISGATPAWDGQRCSGTYCHGGTLSGGSNTAPRWTVVDGTEVACGTCHGVPPPEASGHPAVAGAAPAACAECHPQTVMPDGALDLAGGRHIDGVVQLGAAACTGCHGDPTRLPAEIAAAPPRDANGGSTTSSIGVGAHQRHLAGASLRAPVPCTECHARVEDLLQHPDGSADVAWGPLARAGGAAPSWDAGTASCAATYCHGATLRGGTATRPVWTRVDGTQSACGACHGVPPSAPHVQDLACGTCHTGYTSDSVNAALHIDGYVEIDHLTCTSCHGDPRRPAAIQAAPPSDLAGNTSTASPGVGAHQAHLTGTSQRRAPIACAECHPPITSTSHAQGQNLVVEVRFGPLATAGGAHPAWDAASATCASTYCHGATLAGGRTTAPRWTRVDGSQVLCGSCHGVPPPEPHPPRSDCGSCHAGYTETAVELATHLNGVLDVTGLGCTTCHGSATRADAPAQPAPPTDTRGQSSPAARGVGAHQKHLVAGTLRAAIPCDECHAIPTEADHADASVDLTFGRLAGTGGAAPAWNAASLTCSGVYCHGATLTGGTSRSPTWTRVDGTQAACGACHGVPPPAPHVQDPNCGGCHAGYSTTTVALATHVDGVLDVQTTCTSCHGDDAAPPEIAPAPPRDTLGNVATAAVGVGAHRAHLEGGAMRASLPCGECHAVVDAATHPDGTLELVFGPLARANGAAPAWRPATSSCATTYCHGATLTGGAVPAPDWTRVDGTQARCGACHGVPPSTAAHAGLGPTSPCASCHPGYGPTTVDPARHVDGVVDAAGTSCTSCHGDDTRAPGIAPAPPRDTAGNAATSARGVGAHQRHLAGGTLRPAIACTECHAVPASMAGHPDQRVDLAFGPLASAGGAAPVWNGADLTCAASYCHGATLSGGTLRSPVWTRVDGTQAACGTCHGVPPPAPHVQSSACGSCHSGYSSTSVNASQHVDGVVQAASMTCTSCHGDPRRTLVTGADSQARAAPPVDTGGGGASSLRGVGAHLAHVNRGTGAIAAPTRCSECHVVPSSNTHANGAAQVTFGTLARAGGVSPRWDGTGCADTYCHGNHPNGSRAAPTWTAAGPLPCTSCHPMPPNTTSHTRRPDDHDRCNSCHKDTDAAGTRITNPSLHVNGKVNGLCDDCHR